MNLCRQLINLYHIPLCISYGISLCLWEIYLFGLFTFSKSDIEGLSNIYSWYSNLQNYLTTTQILVNLVTKNITYNSIMSFKDLKFLRGTGRRRDGGGYLLRFNSRLLHKQLLVSDYPLLNINYHDNWYYEGRMSYILPLSRVTQ